MLLQGIPLDNGARPKMRFTFRPTPFHTQPTSATDDPRRIPRWPLGVNR
jgi:hypothetical protein